MTTMWASILLLAKRRFTAAVVVASLALSVKMNILLFLNGLVTVLFRSQTGPQWFISALIFVTVQILVSLPFTQTSPGEYITSAFNLGRQFLYKWTVNFRFLNEDTFLDQRLGHALLALHVILLGAFEIFKWTPIGKKGIAWALKQIHRRESLSSKGESALMLCCRFGHI